MSGKIIAEGKGQTRLDYIDIAKALGIIAVMISHGNVI